MKNTRRLVLGFFAAFLLAGCFEQPAAPPQATNRREQEQAAIRAAAAVQFNGNAEIAAIQGRLQLTSNPDLLGYIVLLNEAGQPILYEGVKGKVTSGSKRLNPVDQVEQRGVGGTNGGVAYQVRAAPSDEGTHGSSNPYIFYTNTDGVYRQWSGNYLYSTQPIRLRVEPLVITALPQGQSR